MIASKTTQWLRRCIVLMFPILCPAVAISAPQKLSDEQPPAAVREFVAKNLAIGQTLQPFVGSYPDDYGFSVALSERFAIVGSASESAGEIGFGGGAVYIYQRVNTSSGQPWRLIQVIFGENLEAFADRGPDRFGESVALSGTTLVVGAPQDKDDGNGVVRVGSVYVFTYDLARTPSPGFVLRSKLLASAAGLGVGGALFGSSVALAGPHLLVGIPGADPPGFFNIGAAVLYSCPRPLPPQIACALRRILGPPDQNGNAQFGASVAVTLPLGGNIATAIVGAPGQCAFAICPNDAPGEGAAYGLSVPSTGPIPAVQKIRDATPSPGAQFGASVATDGLTAAVGAPGLNGGAGSVRIFVRSQSGFQIGALLTPPVQQSMAFGRAVSLSGSHLAVGAPTRSLGTPEAAFTGSTFVFERIRTQWVRRDEVFRSGATSNSLFGQAVAIGGGALLVGEPSGPMTPTFSPGRAYGYLIGRNAKLTRIANPATPSPDNDRFGSDVAVSGGFMAVGLPNRQSLGAANSGEVRLYQQNPAGVWAPTTQASIAFPESIFLANARFGHAVAFTQNASHLIVGAPGATNNSPAAVGAVFVYERSGTTFVPAVQKFKFVRPNGVAGEDFGAAVDVSSSANLMIVGAPEAGGGIGGVTVFKDSTAPAPASGKVGNAKFDDGGNVPPPAGGGIGDKWGTSVATDGNQAVAGAPENGVGDTGGDGFATVIDDGGSGTFANTDMIPAPADAGGAGTDQQDFGASVDIDDGMVAVGAPGSDMPDGENGGMNADEGAAYAYQVSGDPPQASAPTMLDQPGGGIGDKWGSSVGMDDGSVAAGGPGADVPTDTGASVDQGAVSTYECLLDALGVAVCGYDETLFGKNASSDEAIGSSIDMENGEIVLGAPDAGASDEGAIYVSEDLFAVDGLFRNGFE